MQAKKQTPPPKQQQISTPNAQKNQTNSEANRYRKFFIQTMFETKSIDLCKTIFFSLIKYLDIDALKKSPFFTELKNNLLPQISLEAIWSYAVYIVQRDKLSTLKFLIDECNFSLQTAKDANHVTLLHEACLYGREKIVSYLLEKNADVNAKDLAGYVPLNRVVSGYAKVTSLIVCLQKHGANVSVTDNAGVPLWYHAAHAGNVEAVEKLKALGVNPNVKHLDTTCSEYLNASKKKTYAKKQITLPLDNPSPEEIAITDCTHILVSENVDLKKVKNSINFFKKKATLPYDRVVLCFNAYLLSSSFDLKTTVDRFLIDFCKTASSNIIFLVQIAIEFFSAEKKFDVIESLSNCLWTLLSRETITSLPDIIAYYLNIVGYYLLVKSFKRAEESAKKGLLLLPKLGFEAERAALWYNLGASQEAQLNFLSASESYGNAFELQKDNYDFFVRHITLLLSQEKYDLAGSVCRLSKCDAAQIYTLHLQYLVGALSGADVLKALNNISPEINKKSDEVLKIMLLAFQTDYAKLVAPDSALVVGNQYFALSEEVYSKNPKIRIEHAIITILHLYVSLKKPKEGLLLSQKCQKKYPQEFAHSRLLKNFMVYLYLANNHIDDALQLIKQLQQSKHFVFSVEILICLVVCMICEKNKKVFEVFDEILSCNPENEVILFYKELANNFFKKSIETNLLSEASNTPSVEMVSSPFPESEVNKTIEINRLPSSDPDIIIESDEVIEEQKPEHWDPVKIHQFCQQKKQQYLFALGDKLSSTKRPKAVWKIGKEVYREGDKDVVSLDSLFYERHYVVIDRCLSVDKKFEEALGKNVCERKFGQSGIKILQNTLVELKCVKEDNRLYTTTVYDNQNHYLAILNKQGNHLKIKAVLRSKKQLEVIVVSEAGYVFEETKNTNNTNNQEANMDIYFRPVLSPISSASNKTASLGRETTQKTSNIEFGVSNK